MLDWYKKEGIIKNKEFVFEKFFAKRHKLWQDFRKTAKENKQSMIYIIESSGTNKEIN